MKNRFIKQLLKGSDGSLCDVTGDFLGMLRPKFLAQIGNVLIWH
jgi:hypothetical protein